MIATILLLAITVTLFTAIFFFIQDFPKPAPHSVSQFSAFIGYRAGSSAIVSVTIDHLAGPAVSGTTSKQAAIYIASENRSNTWGPFLLSQGLPNAATNWVFGQAWNCTSACAGFPSLFAPDNLTIKLISGGGLLFEDSIRAVFPGFAPYFQRASVAPTSGGTFHSASPTTFSVAATVVCSVSCQVTNPVLLNYSEFVGKASPSVA
ncbi:MAG TPA: hypothetical protein VGS23_04445, partial [Thermoplasmata archaeon]|nr:hypothetical protein [Thermoplasmata archaeon]